MSSYALIVRHTDACHSQSAQGTYREHAQAGSCPRAKDDSGKPGARFFARSKRGTRFRTASLLGGTKQRDGFVRFRWGETKEQETAGGARLMIETGAGFPIGPRKGSARGNAADACGTRSRVSCVSAIHAPNGGYLTLTAPSGGPSKYYGLWPWLVIQTGVRRPFLPRGPMSDLQANA